MRHVQIAAAMLGALAVASGASAQTATTTKTTTARHYDCSKPGNANKTVCKAASPAAPAAAPAAPAAPSAPAPAAPSVVARRTITHRTTSVKTTTTGVATSAGPNGATAVCNDGSYSHSAHHQGSCSRHGGVKQFY